MGAVAKERPVSWKRARESGTALYLLRRSTGLNRQTFARIANFSERTLATYEKYRKLPPPVRPQINEALRLVRALMQIIPSDQLPKWLPQLKIQRSISSRFPNVRESSIPPS